MTTAEELMKFILFDRADLVGAALLTLLELAGNGGVLVHCRVGKDRTGVVAALLLSNAGVQPEVIADDHALSRQYLEPLFATWAQRSPDDGARALAATRKFIPTRESMLHLLATVTSRHGGVPNYLREIGLAGDEIAALRLVLLGDAASRIAAA